MILIDSKVVKRNKISLPLNSATNCPIQFALFEATHRAAHLMSYKNCYRLISRKSPQPTTCDRTWRLFSKNTAGVYIELSVHWSLSVTNNMPMFKTVGVEFCSCRDRGHTPRKINMEHKIHPIEKENNLPKPSFSGSIRSSLGV